MVEMLDEQRETNIGASESESESEEDECVSFKTIGLSYG